jgi:hypothetical protein
MPKEIFINLSELGCTLERYNVNAILRTRSTTAWQSAWATRIISINDVAIGDTLSREWSYHLKICPLMHIPLMQLITPIMMHGPPTFIKVAHMYPRDLHQYTQR